MYIPTNPLSARRCHVRGYVEKKVPSLVLQSLNNPVTISDVKWIKKEVTFLTSIFQKILMINSCRVHSSVVLSELL